MSRIIGTGAFCPEIVTDKKFIDIYGKKAMAVSRLLQHHSRYLATDIETGHCLYSNIEMGYMASRNALEQANLEAEKIDMIIYSTATPNYILPPCFALLQEKLGIKECQGFELRSGCAGFGTAISIANTYISAGKAQNVLIVGADLLSTRFIELLKEKSKISLKTLFNHMFFGDGAGAIIVSATKGDTKGILYSEIKSNGAHYPYGSILEIGGSEHPYPTENINRERWALHQEANLSERYLPKILIETMKDIQNKTDIRLEEMDLYIMPVESAKIKAKVLKELPFITDNKIFSCGLEGGALINAAIPIALDRATRNGKIVNGSKVVIYAAENTKWQHSVTVIEW